MHSCVAASGFCSTTADRKFLCGSAPLQATKHRHILELILDTHQAKLALNAQVSGIRLLALQSLSMLGKGRRRWLAVNSSSAMKRASLLCTVAHSRRWSVRYGCPIPWSNLNVVTLTGNCVTSEQRDSPGRPLMSTQPLPVFQLSGDCSRAQRLREGCRAGMFRRRAPISQVQNQP